MTHTLRVTALASCLFAATLVGCGPAVEAPATEAETPEATAHVHPSAGPHEGELIELGNEEYHGELLHDDSAVTIYILDSGATKQVAIPATEVTINVSHDGSAEQFKLAAQADSSDPAGQSSCFVSTDAELIEHLGGHVHGSLVLAIDGKSFSGDLPHAAH